MNKSLKDISWKVTEDEYRKDPSLSYSTLARFERSGFEGLASLFEKIETPSLTFGSAVDSIITGGEEEFNERFMVADYPNIPDTIIKIVKRVFFLWGSTYLSLSEIPEDKILEVAKEFNYQPTWGSAAKMKHIMTGESYYNLLFLAGDRAIISTSLYTDVLNTVRALKESEATKWYFDYNDPFDTSIERFYQLKFKATFDNVDYRCMMDEVIVDHKNKKIYLIDLKTSGKPEYLFSKSFLEWRYDIQGRLYYRIFKDNVEKDDYFKDFEIEPYRFIVVNRNSLNPKIWVFSGTTIYGEIKHPNTVLRDPFDIGGELDYYLKNNSKVPLGIKDENIIEDWI